MALSTSPTSGKEADGASCLTVPLLPHLGREWEDRPRGLCSLAPARLFVTVRWWLTLTGRDTDCQLDRPVSQSETIPRLAASVGHFITTTKRVTKQAAMFQSFVGCYGTGRNSLADCLTTGIPRV